MKTLIGLSAITSWPLSLLICYFERNNEDEETKEALKVLKSSSKTWMFLEITIAIIYFIILVIQFLTEYM